MGKQSAEDSSMSGSRRSSTMRHGFLVTPERAVEPGALAVVSPKSPLTDGAHSLDSSIDLSASQEDTSSQGPTDHDPSKSNNKDKEDEADIHTSMTDSSYGSQLGQANGRRSKRASIQQVAEVCQGDLERATSLEPVLPAGAHAVRFSVLGTEQKLSTKQMPAGSIVAISRQAHKAPRLSMPTTSARADGTANSRRSLRRPPSNKDVAGSSGSLAQVKARHSFTLSGGNNVVDVDDLIAAASRQRQQSHNRACGKSFSWPVPTAEPSIDFSMNEEPAGPADANMNITRSLPTRMVSAHLVLEDPEVDTWTDVERNAFFEQAQKDAEEAVHEKIMRDIVLAEAVVEEDGAATRKRRRSQWCFGIFLLILIFCGGSLAGSRPWNGDENDADYNTDVAVPPPVNDFCSGAISMVWGTESQFQEGTTIGATDSKFPSCGPGEGEFTWGNSSVWYSITGNGIPLRVSADAHTMTDENNETMEWYVDLSIFTGECGLLSCLGGAEIIQDGWGALDSAVTWFAEEGVEYFICLHARMPEDIEMPSSLLGEMAGNADDFSGVEVGDKNSNATRLTFSTAGNFSLTVDPAVSNDFCPGAVGLNVEKRNGGLGNTTTVYVGSTKEATLDTSLEFCAGTESKEGGVWFRASGTGNPLQVRIEPEDGFNAQVTVFQQGGEDKSSCDLLECIAGDNEVFRYSSQVTWPSDAGTTYYILVHGVSRTGDFELSIKETVTNDVCEGSLELESVERTSIKRIEGTTVGASPMAPLPVCGHAVHSGAGVWFSVVGTGSVMHVSTCRVENLPHVSNDLSLAATAISVFRGLDCASLECIDGNATSSCSSTHGAVIWDSESGQVYHILVSGQLDEVGSFDLSWGIL
jgi:hypothetical protein